MKKKKIKYTEGEIGEFRIIKDFLPPPSQLVKREETSKITLVLSRESLDFFRREAKKCHVPYQRMIRALVDQYAKSHA